MPICTFFGHRDCPETIKPKLRDTLVDLIANHGVNLFYVGHQGRFDALVRSVLRELKSEYPQIDYAVVLAYMPGKQSEYYDHSDTILPEGIEYVQPRYAISWRNNWMIRRSDYIVAYITCSWGGAAQHVEKARRQGKKVVYVGGDVKWQHSM